jgi:hypothetical protein
MTVMASVVAVLLLVAGATSASPHLYTDSFDDAIVEYDFTILDPHHAFGAPYGGFLRATRSRLAALPLHLPHTVLEHPPDEARHFQVRDESGRLFACRVYHEDELDPESLGESMFDSPKLRLRPGNAATEGDTSSAESHVNPAATTASTPTTDAKKAARTVPQTESRSSRRSRHAANQVQEKDPVPASAQAPSITDLQDGAMSTSQPPVPVQSPESATASNDPNGNVQVSNTATATNADAADPSHPMNSLVGGADTDPDATMIANAKLLFVISSRLRDLEDVCGQIHKGWWCVFPIQQE